MIQIQRNETYRNKKNGNIYLLIATAIDASNSKENEDKDMAVYISLSGPVRNKIFVRELTEFYEKFEKIWLKKTEKE